MMNLLFQLTRNVSLCSHCQLALSQSSSCQPLILPCHLFSSNNTPQQSFLSSLPLALSASSSQWNHFKCTLIMTLMCVLQHRTRKLSCGLAKSLWQRGKLRCTAEMQLVMMVICPPQVSPQKRTTQQWAAPSPQSPPTSQKCQRVSSC